jgi:hypothetical protein
MILSSGNQTATVLQMPFDFENLLVGWVGKILVKNNDRIIWQCHIIFLSLYHNKNGNNGT